jgi:uroporphyrin-III C-methyltransferase/precorrin-2 dehydrogenase/sirohydrochlorin ferrochelatase
MDYLPLHFNLKGRRCLLVGGGEIGQRKADLLLQAGASITVVAFEIGAPLRAMLADGLAEGRHVIMERGYASADILGKSLVISATDNAVVNEQVASDANAIGIPVNVVDKPALCSVIFPAIVDRSPVVLSISTGGKSPVLTRMLRQLLETLVPAGLTNLANYMGSRRDDLKLRITDVDDRRRFTEAFMTSPGYQYAIDNNYEKADEYLNLPADTTRTGEVFLVGAGPGDADLLTLKALQFMQLADIVLYDNLVSPTVLARVRRDATKEYVGKIGGDVSTPQENINDKLVRLALAGNRVLRLKGGDPFIFGRGGEELESLVAAGIPFHVVPGITAASGCASYAGIPLTHRDYSQSVRFVTGHPKQGKVDLDWQEFAQRDQTVVFYMGLGGLASICTQLIAHGRGEDTPVAVIYSGTLPNQRVICGDLTTIVEAVKQAQIARPTLIIVGEVVRLREKLGYTGE